MYCKPLIEAGRVYAAISPLYHVNKGKKNWQYFTDKNDFMNYVQEQFVATHTVTDMNKKKLTKSQLHSLIMKNQAYKDLLQRIADTYAIYPVLLEDLLMIRNYEFKKFKKFIEGKYRFVKVTETKGIRVVEGLVNEKSHKVILSNLLINACAPLFQYIDHVDMRYYVNGKKCGLYELLKLFQDSEPKNIERAKGLGSLNAREIGISTLEPKNRKLLRYTCTDIEKEIEEMRKVNDDKFTLIKSVDISQYEF